MAGMQFSERGIPILPLNRKLKALEHCMLLDEPQNEDSVGHLLDLLYYLAPGWNFLGLEGIREIRDHYCSQPTPILPPEF
jgi:hypothetical protein